jgi:hypothetical protein
MSIVFVRASRRAKAYTRTFKKSLSLSTKLHREIRLHDLPGPRNASTLKRRETLVKRLRVVEARQTSAQAKLREKYKTGHRISAYRKK